MINSALTISGPSYSPAAGAQQGGVEQVGARRLGLRRVGLARAAMVAVVLAVGAWPLLVCVPAPLLDWPNHLARVHVLDALLRGGGGWERFYSLNTFAVPNVALDLGVLALVRAGVPEAMAGQGFLLLTYAVFVGGFVALARRFGRVGPGRVALGVAMFLTGPLFWGLVNYVFGLGVLMAALAVWLGTGARGRLLVAVAATGVTFFLHLIAAAALVATLGLFEASAVALADGRWRTRWRGRVSSLAALATLVVCMAVSPADSSHAVGYHDPSSALDFLRLKAVIFAQWAVVGGTWPLRIVTAACALAALVAALSGQARPRLAHGALAAVVGLAVLAVLAPEHLGTGSLLDDRLALLPPLLLAATLRPNLARPRAARVAAGLLVALALARAGTLAVTWLGPAAEFRDYDAAVARLPAGSLVVMAHGRPLADVGWTEPWAKPYTSIETQAVFHGDFVPMIFANPAQQPVALRAAFDGMNQPLDFSDAAREVRSMARLRAMCAGDYPGVAVTVLYADPARRFRDAAGASVELYGTDHVRLLDGCRMAGLPSPSS